MNVSFVRVVTAVVAAVAVLRVPLGAQDRLKSMPGYDQYQKMSREIPGSVKLGAIAAQWKEDASSFEYTWDGKRYRYDIAAKQAAAIGDAPAAGGFGGRGRGGQAGQPARGRQFDSAESPDKKLKAFYKDRNIWLSAADGSNAVQLTTDGSEKDRVKYGTASWVYGEELAQRTAMWWSPDSRMVAYYRFDEKPVPDFYLQMDQTQVQDTLDVEAYPKPGKPNPVVDLFVYDVVAKKPLKSAISQCRTEEDHSPPMGAEKSGSQLIKGSRSLPLHPQPTCQ